MSIPRTVLTLLVCCVLAVPAAAQTLLDKVISTDEGGDPIVFTSVEPPVIGRLARAAGVPMGIEIALGPAPTSPSRRLTGLTVRSALEVMSTIDPRYEWREMDGVIVLRPVASSEVHHPLDLPVQALELRDIRARNALSVAAALLGAPQYAGTQLNDNRRFSVHFTGGTVLDFLNAAVRAHGELAWSFEMRRVEGTAARVAYTVTIYTGSGGFGCGVPGGRSFSPVDVSRYVDPSAEAIRASNPVLARIVGKGPNELPLVVRGPSPSDILNLANATRVPMGIEFLAKRMKSGAPDIRATGRTLREVLDAMIANDPRYEWREMDGVIVIRPGAAWRGRKSVLSRVVHWRGRKDVLSRAAHPIHLIDVAPNEAARRFAREVGYPGPITGISGNRLSLDLPRGTVLDLANAIVRTYGELTWALSAEPFRDLVLGGFPQTFTFDVMGGTGIMFGAR